MNSSRDKVMNRENAVAWRRACSGRVVFTNGVFDLLHPGHVELLEQARSFGDALIVGVNTDSSVQRLSKGPERPLVPGSDRARVLAGMASVDCVVMFDEDTPLRLIEAVQPDVLVKGGDYAFDQIVGGDLVLAGGGRVVRVPRLESFSTTGLVEHIRASS
jgi:rfaE bifunctional protein nucleotidyltransferase chain/domain